MSWFKAQPASGSVLKETDWPDKLTATVIAGSLSRFTLIKALDENRARYHDDYGYPCEAERDEDGYALNVPED